MAVAAPVDPEAEAALEQRRLSQCAQRWIGELGLSEKAQHKWLQRAKRITALYKRENSADDARRRFAMLWSNTQTILPAVYSRPPQPVVTRRFKDADPVGRAASEVLERALVFSIDKQDFDGRMRSSAFDYVLIGRGQAWERYVPTHGPEVTPEIELQPVTTGDTGEESFQDPDGKAYEGEVMRREGGEPYGLGEPYEPVIYEESLTDYVNWEDFGHSVARTWDEVSYVWRRVYLTREQCIERFGEKLGKLVPLDWGPVQQGRADEGARLQRKAAIYEIWSKPERKVYWISKSWNSRPLDERDDPLGLDGFFPCGRPLLATTANDSVIPVPDFVFYQDQAEEIDELTARIAHLQKALKVRGFYAAAQTTNLNNLLNSDNNMLIPVPDWVKMKEGGGVAGNIEWFPIAQVVAALQALLEQRAQMIADVYQITGVADIMRGMNDPRATATAEKIKGQWGTLRVRDRQTEMQRFARDQLRIKAEVIAEKFDAETLKAMSGVKLPTAAEKAELQAQIQQQQAQAALAAQAQQAAPQMPGAPPSQMGHNGGPPMPAEPPEEIQAILRSPTWEDVIGLLRNNALRQFRIDIETDSTIEPDEAAEKAAAVEFIGAVGQMIAQWGPAIEAQPLLAPMAGAFIKWGSRKFRAGREMEDVIDSTVDDIVAAAANAPPPGAPAAEPPDQTPIAVAQIEQQTANIEEQGETQRAMIQAQVDQGQQAIDQQSNQLKLVAINRDPYPQGAA